MEWTDEWARLLGALLRQLSDELLLGALLVLLALHIEISVGHLCLLLEEVWLDELLGLRGV